MRLDQNNPRSSQGSLLRNDAKYLSKPINTERAHVANVKIGTASNHISEHSVEDIFFGVRVFFKYRDEK
jgi:hypothetical protein